VFVGIVVGEGIDVDETVGLSSGSRGVSRGVQAPNSSKLAAIRIKTVHILENLKLYMGCLPELLISIDGTIIKDDEHRINHTPLPVFITS
jgi:hypothetical protein